ncbi:MAG: PAS domain S-box protein, partial [Chloroflexi bacterium]|nr:PAS domain S-box protein [Chloroflexota bacterium]
MTPQADERNDSTTPAPGAEPAPAATLRQRAEEQARARGAEDLESLSPEETHRLLHELRVHQIELELQNEELRRAQEELAASRARYFDLYDLAPVGYLTLSESGLIREANLTAATLLGVARGDLVQQPLTRFILPADQDIYYRHRQQLFATGEPQVCEMRMLRKDSDPFWARVEASAGPDAAGALVCRAVLSDITARQQAEETLRESEERYRDLVQHSHDLICTHDLDGNLLSVNPAATEISGYTEAELLTMNMRDLLAPEARDLFEAYRTAIQTHGRAQGVLLAQTKNGARRILEYDNSLRTAGVAVPIVRGTARDITARQQAAARERLAREVLEMLNQPEGPLDTVRGILLLVKQILDVDAVAIRLHEGDDYPYYQTNGLPEAFVQAERFLCARDEAGQIVRDSQGNPVLECMCGSVLCGRTNAALPFFTENGSFWTNSTTQLLASTTEQERQAQTRNRCHGEGYESVALIPLRSDHATLGLLQLNDRRSHRFTPELIRFLEGLGASIGVALFRKRTTAEMARVAREWQTTFDATNDAVWTLDSDQRVVRSNQTATRFFQRPGEELIGQHCWKIVHGTTQPIPECPLLQAQQTRRRETATLQIGAGWFQVTVDPIWDAAGQYAGAVHIVRDITARQLAEEAQRAQFERAAAHDRALVYLATQGVPAAPDFRAAAQAITQAAAEATGVARVSVWLLHDDGGQLSCVDLYELGPGRHSDGTTLDAARYPRYFAALAASRVIDAAEARHDPRTSEFRADYLLSWGITAMLDATIREAGQVVGVVCFEHVGEHGRTWHPDELAFAREVADQAVQALSNAERQRAEAALRHSEAQYRQIVETANEGIWLIDQDSRTSFVNQKMADMLGYTVAEMLGQALFDFMDDEGRVIAEANVERRKRGIAEQHDFKFQRQDGTAMWAILGTSPIFDADGHYAGALAMVSDITARKQAEEQLQQQTADLSLINALNHAANQGASRPDILDLLSRETKKMFACHGATVYLLTEDQEYLVVQNLNLPPALVRRIEKLIGMRIPALRIRMNHDSLYRAALQAGTPQIISDPTLIQGMMAELTENELLKKLVPRISRLLGIGSVMHVPLMVAGEAIGLLDISRQDPFTASDLRRFEALARQTTAILQRQRAEARLEHLNAVLRATRNVNQLIVREKGREQLLQGACAALVEARGYYNAWIALFDEARQLVASAAAGETAGSGPLVEHLQRGQVTRCGRQALAQPGIVVVADPLSTCGDCPLAGGYGQRGAMTVRLEHAGRVYGVLTVALPTVLSADQEEQALFIQVAGDVALGLYSMDMEQERQQAQERLRRLKEFHEGIVQSMAEGIVLEDARGTITFVNPAAAALL